MRKLALLAVLASTTLATPAFARDGAWYVGVEGGAMIVEDLDFDLPTASNALTVDSEYGFDVDGIVGYDFGGFRLEGEVSYKSADVDKFRVNNAAARFPTGASLNFPGGPTYGGTGETDVLSFMINGLLDFGPDDGLNGFVGGGAGIARVKADQYASYPTDTDSRFAWQAIAGVRAPLTDTIDVVFGILG